MNEYQLLYTELRALRESLERFQIYWESRRYGTTVIEIDFDKTITNIEGLEALARIHWQAEEDG